MCPEFSAANLCLVDSCPPDCKLVSCGLIKSHAVARGSWPLAWERTRRANIHVTIVAVYLNTRHSHIVLTSCDRWPGDIASRPTLTKSFFMSARQSFGKTLGANTPGADSNLSGADSE